MKTIEQILAMPADQLTEDDTETLYAGRQRLQDKARILGLHHSEAEQIARSPGSWSRQAVPLLG